MRFFFILTETNMLFVAKSTVVSGKKGLYKKNCKFIIQYIYMSIKNTPNTFEGIIWGYELYMMTTR